jgi:hypothetical protein
MAPGQAAERLVWAVDRHLVDQPLDPRSAEAVAERQAAVLRTHGLTVESIRVARLAAATVVGVVAHPARRG